MVMLLFVNTLHISLCSILTGSHCMENWFCSFHWSQKLRYCRTQIKCLKFIHNYSHHYKCSSFFSDKLGVEFFCFPSERCNVYSIDQLGSNSRKSTSFHLNSNLGLNSALILVSAQCFHRFSQHKRLQRTKYLMTPLSALHRTRLTRPNGHTHTEVVIVTRYCFISLLNCH